MKLHILLCMNGNDLSNQLRQDWDRFASYAPQLQAGKPALVELAIYPKPLPVRLTLIPALATWLEIQVT